MREVWGTYSVRDHLSPDAFLADVMLFDHLVVPVPPNEDTPDEKGQFQKWEEAGADPKRQQRLIRALGPMVRTVAWNKERRDAWKTGRQNARASVASELAQTLHWTRGELTQGLPAYVTGVEAVTMYPSLHELEEELGVRKSDGAELKIPGGAVCAVLGHEYLVPYDDRRDPGDIEQHAALLERAVTVAMDKDFRRKRASFYRWEREFVQDGLTDPESVNKAAEDMADLLADVHAAVPREHLKTRVRYAFRLAPSSVGVGVAIAAAASPLALAAAGAGVFLAVGGLTFDRWAASKESLEPPPHAMFETARRELGWPE
jgi:hypothetical protein